MLLQQDIGNHFMLLWYLCTSCLRTRDSEAGNFLFNAELSLHSI